MKIKTLAIALALLFGTATFAEADDFTINLSSGFSTSITGMTNYVARGISQTGNMPAINPVETYQFKNGLFGSVGAVNSIQGNGNVEVDLTVGYATKLSDSWLYQTSFVYTTYPGSSNYNNISTIEFQHIFNYVQPWGKLVAAFATQPQGQNHGGFYTYTSGGADFNLPKDFTLGFRVGYNTYSNHSAHPNYVDWTVTLSRPITTWVSWQLQYTGSTDYATNLDPGNGQHVIGSIVFSF